MVTETKSSVVNVLPPASCILGHVIESQLQLKCRFVFCLFVVVVVLFFFNFAIKSSGNCGVLGTDESLSEYPVRYTCNLSLKERS